MMNGYVKLDMPIRKRNWGSANGMVPLGDMEISTIGIEGPQAPV